MIIGCRSVKKSRKLSINSMDIFFTDIYNTNRYRLSISIEAEAHNNDTAWASMRLKSQATPVIALQLVYAYNKENNKASHYWLCVSLTVRFSKKCRVMYEEFHFMWSASVSGPNLGLQPAYEETSLQSNAVSSHWLGANLESALSMKS